MVFFKDSEFTNRALIDDHTVNCLEAFRGDAGVKMRVNSDVAIGGHSGQSWHYIIPGRNDKGRAIDLSMLSDISLWDFIFKAQKAGFTGIGVYIKDGAVRYAHLDTRNTSPQLWIGVVVGDETQYMYSLKAS